MDVTFTIHSRVFWDLVEVHFTVSHHDEHGDAIGRSYWTETVMLQEQPTLENADRLMAQAVVAALGRGLRAPGHPSESQR